MTLSSPQRKPSLSYYGIKRIFFQGKYAITDINGLQAQGNALKDSEEKKARHRWMTGLQIYSGGVLLSHDLSVIVSSAQEDFTSVFEMGTGVTPPV